jgi:hypothetical protein
MALAETENERQSVTGGGGALADVLAQRLELVGKRSERAEARLLTE